MIFFSHLKYEEITLHILKYLQEINKVDKYNHLSSNNAQSIIVNDYITSRLRVLPSILDIKKYNYS